MSTAELPAGRLDELQRDPAVVSVAVAKPLRSPEQAARSLRSRRFILDNVTSPP